MTAKEIKELSKILHSYYPISARNKRDLKPIQIQWGVMCEAISGWLAHTHADFDDTAFLRACGGIYAAKRG